MGREKNERTEIRTYHLLSPIPSFCLLRLGWGKNFVVFQNIDVKVLTKDFCPMVHDGAMKTDVASSAGIFPEEYSK